jgi:uncharacterized protein YuzE
MEMKIEYDKDADAAYIYFKEIEEGEVVQTISLNDSVNIDMDEEGRTLGIEILDASKNMPVSAINSAVILD